MAHDELVIEVAGSNEGARLASFLTVAANTLDILTGIGRTLDPHRPIDWRISSVRLGSPLRMTIRGLSRDDLTAVPRIVDAYLNGVASLDAAEAIPRFWRAEEMLKAKAIAGTVNREDVEGVAFSGNGKRVAATERIAAHVDAVLREVEDRATFDGRLELINVHSGWSFNVYDDLTGKRIPCHFDRKLFEAAKDALGHRVSIYGVARYDQVGDIKSVKVETIDRLPDTPQLSDIAETPGIDITGGIESSQYIRALRDE